MMWTRVHFDLDLQALQLLLVWLLKLWVWKQVSGDGMYVHVARVCGNQLLGPWSCHIQKTIQNFFNNSILTWFSLFLIVCIWFSALSFTRRQWFREELSLDILLQARDRWTGLACSLKPVLSHGKKLVACTGTLHLDHTCGIQLSEDNEILWKVYDCS